MKKFSEIYQLVFKHKGELDTLLKDYKSARNKKLLWFLFIFVALNIIVFFINDKKLFISNYGDHPYLLWFYIFASIIIWGAYYVSIFYLFGDYRNRYKELVIKQIVNTINENFEYIPKKGLTLSEYHQGFKDLGRDMFSEDMIKGTLENNLSFVMSEVYVTHEENTVGEDGNTQETVIDYKGLMGYANLPNPVKSNFEITTNAKYNELDEKRIEMESIEFEQLYDVLADDRLYAMKLLNPQIIEEFLKIKRLGCKGFEIRFENGMAYFRYLSKEIFEPPTRGNILSPEKVKEYIMTVYYPIHILSLMSDAISEECGAVK